MVISCKNIW